MKINYSTNSSFASKKNSNFKGTPLRAPQIPIKNYKDALISWEHLRHAKFLDVHDDAFNWQNKFIRQENYSFLNKLFTNQDKSAFIEHFCKFTSFPFLRDTSNKIHNEFIKCVKSISSDLNNIYNSNRYDILDAGYDPTCSLGLKKAFPGSDLDKGYVILKGSQFGYDDNNIANNFKAEIWNRLDQRLASLNHNNTDLNIYTSKQIENTLRWLDSKTKQLESKDNRYFGIKSALEILALTFTGIPIGVGSMLRNKHLTDNDTDPYIAGKFNRKLAKEILFADEREKAKNFAFFIETVKANRWKDDFDKTENIFNKISNSPFVNSSNVTQVEAWKEKINEGYLKRKLQNREKLESDFFRMTTDTKYELIKDIIKSASEDQSNRFSEYFKNDDDISQRYKKLLNALK